jgi:hypothetical protein
MRYYNREPEPQSRRPRPIALSRFASGSRAIWAPANHLSRGRDGPAIVKHLARRANGYLAGGASSAQRFKRRARAHCAAPPGPAKQMPRRTRAIRWCQSYTSRSPLRVLVKPARDARGELFGAINQGRSGIANEPG